MLNISLEAKKIYPDLTAGIMIISNINNRYLNNRMETESRTLENTIKKTYEGVDRKYAAGTDVMSAYCSYYKKFTKTYHVLLQLESIAFKNKQISPVSPIVQSMFMGELKNHFLTAVHDFSCIENPLVLDCSNGTEDFICFNGEKKMLKKGDLYIKDTKTIISAILYGMDETTKVTENTSSALYTVYVPFKTPRGKIEEHLTDTAAYLKLNDESISIDCLNVIECPFIYNTKGHQKK